MNKVYLSCTKIAYFLVIFSTCSVFTGTVQAMLREIFIGMGRCGGFRIDKNNVFSAAGENFGQLQHSKCFKNTFKSIFFISKCGNVRFSAAKLVWIDVGFGGRRPSAAKLVWASIRMDRCFGPRFDQDRSFRSLLKSRIDHTLL